MSAPNEPVGSKREKFRKLVERSGIVDVVTKALADLYEEQFQEPDEALEYFRKKISVSSDKELALANAQIRELKAKLAVVQEEQPTSA